MRTLLSGFCRWSRIIAIAAATLGLGYMFAANWPVNANWLYLAILIGFLGCDPSLWSGRSR